MLEQDRHLENRRVAGARQRVWVTGLGMVSPLGLTVPTTWAGILAGQSGIDVITAFDTTRFATHIGAEVKNFDPVQYLGRKEARRRDRFTQLALVAAAEAIADAQLDVKPIDPYRMAVVLGTAVGGLRAMDQQSEVLRAEGPKRANPFYSIMMLADAAPAALSQRFGIKGPSYSIVSACASGADALIRGVEMIHSGDVDIVVAGGSEAALNPLGMACFSALRNLSTRNDAPHRASRPFDVDRDGFVMGEGAAVLILESEASVQRRDVAPRAHLCGYGSTSDAYHVTAPAPEGRGASRAMHLALQRAALKPADVDYINAHGTATKLNDPIETLAIKTTLGGRAGTVPISSTKSMTGHLLGAAGALEAAFCILAIQSGMIPPTINLDNPDPQCDLDYTPWQARRADVTVALSNAFGFGGHNTVLAFSSGNP